MDQECIIWANEGVLKWNSAFPEQEGSIPCFVTMLKRDKPLWEPSGYFATGQHVNSAATYCGILGSCLSLEPCAGSSGQYIEQIPKRWGLESVWKCLESKFIASFFTWFLLIKKNKTRMWFYWALRAVHWLKYHRSYKVS